MRRRFFAGNCPTRSLAFLLLAGGIVGTGADPSQGAAPRLTKPGGLERTITYDVRDLIWNGKTIEWVTEAVIGIFPPAVWRRGATEGFSIREIDGGKLEIRATIKQHGEIVEVMDALRRLADLAVIWEARLFEIENERLKKEIMPALKKGEGPGSLLEKRAVLVHSGKRTSFDGKQVKLLSLRRPVPYRTGPRNKFEVAYTGLSFEVKGIVSPDRRFVRTTVAQHSAEVVALGKGPEDAASEKKLDENGKAPDVQEQVADLLMKWLNVEPPHLRKATVSQTWKIEDGGVVLVPVLHPPPGLCKKGHTLMLVLSPTIHIDAEQRELQGR